MSLRVRIARVVVLAGVLCLLPVVLPVVASAESCPNEQLRSEQGDLRLPDCRAFEMVTPANKADNSTIALGSLPTGVYAFPDGDHVFYGSVLPLPGAKNGGFQEALGERTPSGWTSISITQPSEGAGEPVGDYNVSRYSGNNFAEMAFTSDFSAAFANVGFDSDPLDQDGGENDVYRMDLTSGSWSLAALPQNGPLTEHMNPFIGAEARSEEGTFLAGASADGSHVLFATMDNLSVASGTLSGPHDSAMLYDRTGGNTYQVGILPTGAATPPNCEVGIGNSAIYEPRYSYGALSPDGSNVVFSIVGCPDVGVYLRENDEKTVQLGGDGVDYAGRSADGLKVFTEYESGGGISEYDVATGETTTIGQGYFLASSADGSRVYYWIPPGPNGGLYLWEDGITKVIQAGEGFANEVQVYRSVNQTEVAVATPDGSRLLFLDRADLTGYNSTPSSVCAAYSNSSGEQGGLLQYCDEAYVYDAATGSITCVSCNPSGAPPQGEAGMGGPVVADTTQVPAHSEGEISPDGSRVFFETSEALVPQDTNGLPDVYEWEADGEGSCHSRSQDDGCIYLISSGQGTYGSRLGGASSEGGDVFIVTTDHLAPQDDEDSIQIYDARVDGGFPYAPPSSGCDSGQCQGPQTPAPNFGLPASATFVGLGNPVPAAPVVSAKPSAKPKRKSKPGKGSKARRKPRARKTARRTAGTNGERKGRK